MMRDGYPDGDGFVLELMTLGLFDIVWGEWDYTYNLDLASGALLGVQAGEGMPVDDVLRRLQQPLSPSTSIEISAVGAPTIGVKVSGSLKFPASWTAQMRGKIAPINYNTGYTCETYVVREQTNVISRFFGSPTHVNRVVSPRDFCIDYLLIKGTVGVDASIQASITSEYQREYKKEQKKDFLTAELPMGATPFTVKLTPHIKYGVEARAYGKTELGVRTQGSVSMPLGFEFTRAREEFSLLPNARHPISRSASGSTWAKFHVGSKIKAYAKLGLGVSLGSKALPGFTLHGLDANAGVYGEGTYEPI